MRPIRPRASDCDDPDRGGLRGPTPLRALLDFDEPEPADEYDDDEDPNDDEDDGETEPPGARRR